MKDYDVTKHPSSDFRPYRNVQSEVIPKNVKNCKFQMSRNGPTFLTVSLIRSEEHIISHTMPLLPFI